MIQPSLMMHRLDRCRMLVEDVLTSETFTDQLRKDMLHVVRILEDYTALIGKEIERDTSTPSPPAICGSEGKGPAASPEWRSTRS